MVLFRVKALVLGIDSKEQIAPNTGHKRGWGGGHIAPHGCLPSREQARKEGSRLGFIIPVEAPRVCVPSRGAGALATSRGEEHSKKLSKTV